MQTIRNATQRSLTERLGTMGATHVRFLYGLPFGLALLAAVAATSGLDGLDPDRSFYAWTFAGAMTQIAGTALMLAAMRERAFVVAIAYVKTEPVQIAAFGFLFLGEALGALSLTAVLVATAGVLLMSLPAGASLRLRTDASRRLTDFAALRPAVFGVASGASFALSAVGYRGAILDLGDAAPFYLRSTFTLAVALAIQTVALTAWLLAREPGTLVGILRAWRPSLGAGAAGALASQMWFLAFSLQAAAAVRTVGLVEILFAQAASRKLFSQTTTRREALGIALMVAGVAMLLAA